MEIAVISGKGGTGKSSISAAFASLHEKEVVLADCDVDAANLHLLFNPKQEYEQIFVGARKAVIGQKQCTDCGLCMEYCRFDAISQKEDTFSFPIMLAMVANCANGFVRKKPFI